MNERIRTCKYTHAYNSDQKFRALPRILKVNPYPTKCGILETLIGYVEASKCRILDTYTTIEAKDYDKR